jgi:hypothetical protein
LGKEKAAGFLLKSAAMPIVRYSILCVSALHINYHRNGDMIFNAFIAEFIALAIEHNMTRKQRKADDFH